jgi:cobalt-zinc-cadmium efflux system membrane fusion protein
MLRDLRVTTAKAEARAAGERVSAPGELRVDEDRYAEVAAPISARVAKVQARAGDVVTAGQPLVQLTAADHGRTRAEHAAARTRVDSARASLDRARALYADGLIAEREVKELADDVREAEADAAVAKAALAALGGDAAGGRMVLRAQIAGTVIERSVVLG